MLAGWHVQSWIAALLGIQLLLPGTGQGTGTEPSPRPFDRQAERDRMVNDQIVARGVKDPAVIEALRWIPRHRFVPEAEAEMAYEDRPLPIGYEQTISQPYIVAFMTEALQLQGKKKVLEIGTGSGYQAAVLATIVHQVFTIEIVEPLAERAAGTLKEVGCDNVTVRTGDGYQGWPEEAPFDGIIVTAASDHVPKPLLEQLAIGGRLILPIGKFQQDLVVVRRTEKGYEQTTVLPVAFVPMTGEAQGQTPP
ncbi:MAG: protein-L-isoaspartate(D-aspartate) O-methyltransferase [Nitrospirota bacterium]|nr:protein-L-isoaspartate(D-aspartate) O-methyltransferase [Nitrospirota bacterium]